MKEKFFLGDIGSTGQVSGILRFYVHPEEKEIKDSDIQPKVEEKLWQKVRRQVTNELKKEIRYLSQKKNPQANEAVSVIKTHILALKDPMVSQEIHNKIFQEMKSARRAIVEVFSELMHSLQKLPDLLFQEKARDVEDIKKRLLFYIEQNPPNFQNYAGCIVYAPSLLPGELITLARAGVKGFVLEQSSPTAHELIVARALGLPLLYGIRDKLDREYEGKFAFLDAYGGKLYFNGPKEKEPIIVAFQKQKSVPFQVKLFLNLAFPEELHNFREYLSFGVGLFRSELYFLEKGRIPSLSEQKDLYSEILAHFKNKYFYFRLFDLSQDKKFFSDEKIPLNLRSVRYLEKNPEILEIQLKALAFAYKKTQAKLVIVIPMVTFSEEIDFVNKIVIKNFQEQIPLSVMLEHPAACEMIPFWKNKVHSFHLGTNDLLQFYTATDRHSPLENELLYLIHPANLILLNNIMKKVGKKKVFHCGEYLQEKGFLALLLAIGYRYFSVSPSLLNLFLDNLNQISLKKATNILKKLVAAKSQKEQLGFYQNLISSS